MAYRSHYDVDDHTGWTYFIEAPSVGLVKIGAAKDYLPRFRSIQSCSPVALRLAALLPGRGYEVRCHRILDPYRVRGEWFRADAPGLRELIEQYSYEDAEAV